MVPLLKGTFSKEVFLIRFIVNLSKSVGDMAPPAPLLLVGPVRTPIFKTNVKIEVVLQIPFSFFSQNLFKSECLFIKINLVKRPSKHI